MTDGDPARHPAGIDPQRPTVQRIQAAIALERQGHWEDAARGFAAAWDDACGDNYDACIAAHFLAQVQRDPGEGLRWNRIALDRAMAAMAAGDDQVRGFFASLWLNLGRSHETLGELADASRCYERARAALDDVAEGPYRGILAGGIEAACARVSSTAASSRGDRDGGHRE